MNDERPGSTAPDEAPSSAYANYVLGLLFVVYIFNFVDRQILSILLDPIKKELGVSDQAMGFLTGLAFALFYTIAGIPIARLADRTSRKGIIAVGLTLWSAMTVASGLARTFVQLALARVAVGVGEAAGSPPAHSLISDYFPPERRATALSIYASGVYVGSSLAFILGGYIVTHFDWRTAFFIVGAPGIPLAVLLALTVREPERGLSEGRTADAEEGDTVADVARFLFARKSFLWLAAGSSFLTFPGYGILVWAPAFLGRVHDVPYQEIGLALGLLILVCGVAGVLLGGTLSDRLGRTDKRWYMWIPAAVAVVQAPFAAGFLLFDSKTLALLSFAPFYLVGQMWVGPMLSMTQGLVKLRMRATASAIMLFILNLIGLGAGPWVIGALNDSLASSYGDEAVRWSLLGVTLLGALGSIFFLLASRTLREDLVES